MSSQDESNKLSDDEKFKLIAAHKGGRNCWVRA